MSDSIKAVIGRLVKHPISPPNMIFTKRTGAKEYGELGEKTVVLETIQHVPSTRALKHCPSQPFGLMQAVGLYKEETEDVLDDKEKEKFSRFFEHQHKVASGLLDEGSMTGIKVPLEVPPHQSNEQKRTTFSVDKNSKRVSIKLPFPYTNQFDFQMVTPLCVEMDKLAVAAFMEPAKPSRSDNIFNKHYVQFYDMYVVGNGVAKVPKPTASSLPSVAAAVPAVRVLERKVAEDKPVSSKDLDKNYCVKNVKKKRKNQALESAQGNSKSTPIKHLSPEDKPVSSKDLDKNYPVKTVKNKRKNQALEPAHGISKSTPIKHLSLPSLSPIKSLSPLYDDKPVSSKDLDKNYSVKNVKNKRKNQAVEPAQGISKSSPIKHLPLPSLSPIKDLSLPSLSPIKDLSLPSPSPLDDDDDVLDISAGGEVDDLFEGLGSFAPTNSTHVRTLYGKRQKW